MEPPTLKGLLGGAFVLQITLHHHVPPEQNLPHCLAVARHLLVDCTHRRHLHTLQQRVLDTLAPALTSARRERWAFQRRAVGGEWGGVEPCRAYALMRAFSVESSPSHWLCHGQLTAGP